MKHVPFPEEAHSFEWGLDTLEGNYLDYKNIFHTTEK